jgi:hypothetical protein
MLQLLILLKSRHQIGPDIESDGDYSLLPYRLGLLTLKPSKNK